MKAAITKTVQSVVYLIATTLVLAACSPLTASQREDREYRRANFALQFREFRSRCNASGKKVFVVASQTVDRDGIPNIGDRYFCN